MYLSRVEEFNPTIGIPMIVILWILLMIIILVSLRRAKIKRDKIRRAKIRAARRESYIQIEQEKEEAYLASINPMPERHLDSMPEKHLIHTPGSLKRLARAKKDKETHQ